MHKAKVHTELQKNVSFKDTKESHTKYCHLKEGTKALMGQIWCIIAYGTTLYKQQDLQIVVVENAVGMEDGDKDAKRMDVVNAMDIIKY